MKTQITCLNPYKIFWGIVIIEEGTLSKSRINALAKAADSGASATHCFFHGSKLFNARLERVLETLSVSGVHGKVYVITDKQYGMISNSWNGQEPERAKPFTHQVTIRDGKYVCVVPLSKYQVDNAHIF